MQLKRKERCGSYKKALGFILFLTLCLGGLFYSHNFPTAFATSLNQWTDPVIGPSTPLRAAHVQEMRDKINEKRATAGLPAFAFTDPSLTPGVTRVRAKHFLELEQAIQEYYQSDPLWKTWFMTSFATYLMELNPSVGTVDYNNQGILGPVNKPIRSTNITVLREVIERAGRCGDGICQTTPTGPEACGTCDVDCNTPCNIATSGCGPVPCGIVGPCAAGKRCEATTCFCSTTYACVDDATCSTSCAAQSYNTGSCGSVTIPAAIDGAPSSVACTGSCTGTVTATCNGGTFTGITDGCLTIQCYCRDVGVGATSCETYTHCDATFAGCQAEDGDPLACSAFTTTCAPETNAGNCVSAPVPSCFDGTQNGNETGIDCGGPCAACATCLDGIQNGTETGIDCGGSCPPCATCSDGTQNGTETGIDCGGSCPACSYLCLGANPANATMCTNDNSGLTADTPIKVVAGCTDDGTDATKCQFTCNSGYTFFSDCAATTISDCVLPTSIHETTAGSCQTVPANTCSYTCINGTWTVNHNSCTGTPTCDDNIINQGETGVDCGGPCAACPSCYDGIQNQNETLIDSGGVCDFNCPGPQCNMNGVCDVGESWCCCSSDCPKKIGDYYCLDTLCLNSSC